MIQESSSAMLLLTPMAAALAGLALGRWTAGRGRTARPDPALQRQMEELTRAREASEQANVELRQALDQLEQAAGTDRLTGAWNRRRFEDGATRHIALSDRRRDTLSMILFDLDHFKRVNDTFGHAVGDQVLKAVAQRVRDHLRISDALVRWGGEEFIILCPATTLAGATILAEKIRKAVESHLLPQVGAVTISLGVAQHQPFEITEVWVSRADAALYRAKERGRNCIEASVDVGPGQGEGAISILELTWEPALECGVPEIDHQHRQLFSLSNSLLAAVTAGRYPEDAKLQMQLLLAHVAQHFHDEEAILARTGFPELAAHAREHARLLAKAKALQADMGGDSADLPALCHFLALELVKGHLMAWDRRFFSHVAQA
jgi:diguanylate cyclase (GGDEF)-like protein/hemerythrin-like metal-binding protein